MNPSMQSMVVCEEATLAEGGYVLTHPGIEFESNSVDVFCEIRELHQGVLLRALLLGPDGERCDFSPEELVPQNIPNCNAHLSWVDRTCLRGPTVYRYWLITSSSRSET